MKYMYDDSHIGSESEIILQKRRKEFTIRSREYKDLLFSISSYFPKRFMKRYTESFYFHDYEIESILFQGKYPSSVTMVISDGKNSFSLIYEKVSLFQSNVTDAIYFTDIVYNEILPTENGFFSHEFELSNENSSMMIVFKKLRFRRLKQ